MLAHPRVIGYLTQGLNHEMSAVQQYLTQASLCELWGMPAEAENFRKEAEEELVHAGRLIQRMLVLGVAPNASQLAAVRPGRGLAEMLALDRQLEMAAVRLYHDAALYCARFGDEASALLFEALMREEEAHLGELDRALAALHDMEQRHVY